MKRRLVALVLVLLVTASFGAAKEKSRKRGESGGWGFFGPYAGLFDFNGLNTHLQAAPFNFTEKFSNGQLMYGGGGMAIADNLCIGGYGFGGQQSIRSDSLRLAADYGGGMFELGWLPLAVERVKFGPALGLGGAGFTLRARDAKGFKPDFDSLLIHGDRSWEISNSSFTLAPALNLLIPLSFAGVYLKFGYLLPLFDRNWEASSVELVGTPKLRSSGVFASLQVMLGGSGKGGKAKAKVELKGEDRDDEDGDEPDDDDEKDEPEGSEED
jgi:hypothetical protein